jgi:outer membrane immunogenic protein
MKERAMRSVYCLVLLCAMASPALPADLDVLRGSEPVMAPVAPVGPATFTRWSGFYAGGDFSFNYGQADFSRATQPLVANALQYTVVSSEFDPSQLQALSSGSNSAFGFGGFLGYNTQWQDLIVGVEVDYSHTNLNMASPASTLIAREFPQPVGNVTSVTIDKAAARFSLTDYGELRARAGYVVGNLLPYGFVSAAVGRGSYGASVYVDIDCVGGGSCVGYPLTPNVGQGNALLFGYAAGAGLDWAITPNIFLRGEFEYVQFVPIASISTYIVNARAGAGFKF